MRHENTSHSTRTALKTWREVVRAAEAWSSALLLFGSRIALGGKAANECHHCVDLIVGDVAFESRHVAFSLGDRLSKFRVRFALDRRGPQVSYLQTFAYRRVAATVLPVAGGALCLIHISAGGTTLAGGRACSYRDGNNQQGHGHPCANQRRLPVR